jgi:hypothetical protein
VPARLPALLTTMYVPSSRRTRLPVGLRGMSHTSSLPFGTR